MMNTNLLCALWTAAFHPDLTALDKETEIAILGDPYEYKEIFEFVETCVVTAWERNFCSKDDWYETFKPAWQLYLFAQQNLNV